MKTSRRFYSLFILLCFFAGVVQSQSFILKQKHENGLYKRNEKIQIIAVVNQRSNDSLSVKVWKNNDQLIVKKTVFPVQDTLVIFESAIKDPCSVMLEARINGQKKLI